MKSFTALTLLIGHQEGHLAGKKYCNSNPQQLNFGNLPNQE